jgi:DNA-binding transcriptional LysR family regulator
MELRQLTYFLAVAEERNFTRAAQRIPIAQPAISQQIRRLEADLGERLFTRDRRGIRLTPAGQALLPHARAMLAGRGQVSLQTLRDEPMIALTSASKQRSTLEAACRAAGFEPEIVAETSDLGVVMELVAEQLGIAVLPKSALGPTAKLAQLGLTRPKLDRRILLVWRPADSPPAARAFLALAQQHLTGPAATPT